HDPGIADLLLQVGGRELTFGMCAQFVESCIHCVDPALLVARYGLLEGAPRGVRLTQVHERDILLLYRCVFLLFGCCGSESLTRRIPRIHLTGVATDPETHPPKPHTPATLMTMRTTQMLQWWRRP